MLHIYFGTKENVILSMSDIFDLQFENEWLSTEFARTIVKGIDKSELLYPRVIESPVLGTISPRELSGAVKGLLLMAYDNEYDNKYFCGEQFGDNVLPYLLMLGNTKDIYVTTNHPFKFREDFNQKVYIENYNLTVHNRKEYEDAYIRFILDKSETRDEEDDEQDNTSGED